MTIIRLFANDQKLSVAMGPKIASGDRNSVSLQITFSGNWSRYEKSAVFFTSWDNTVYEVLLDDCKCTVPHEVLAKSGDLYIGVRGVDPDENEVKTSTLVKYRIEKGAPVGDATSMEPTPDVYQQILAKLAEIKEPEKIRVIVAEYLTENPPPRGEKGEKGDKGDPPTYEQVAQLVAAYMEQNKVSTAAIGVAELLADKWVTNGNLHSQVVSIDGVTEHSQVDLTPDVEQLAIFYEKDLTFVTENDGGVVTVYAIGQKPANDYEVQVTITEVNV